MDECYWMKSLLRELSSQMGWSMVRRKSLPVPPNLTTQWLKFCLLLVCLKSFYGYELTNLTWWLQKVMDIGKHKNGTCRSVRLALSHSLPHPLPHCFSYSGISIWSLSMAPYLIKIQVPGLVFKVLYDLAASIVPDKANYALSEHTAIQPDTTVCKVLNHLWLPLQTFVHTPSSSYVDVLLTLQALAPMSTHS